MSKHFIAEFVDPRGNKVGFSTSKSTNSDGKYLAEQIALAMAGGFVTPLPEGSATSEAGAENRLTCYIVVKEWDGLNKAERSRSTGCVWANTQTAEDDLAEE